MVNGQNGIFALENLERIEGRSVRRGVSPRIPSKCRILATVMLSLCLGTHCSSFKGKKPDVVYHPAGTYQLAGESGLGKTPPDDEAKAKAEAEAAKRAEEAKNRAAADRAAQKLFRHGGPPVSVRAERFRGLRAGAAGEVRFPKKFQLWLILGLAVTGLLIGMLSGALGGGRRYALGCGLLLALAGAGGGFYLNRTAHEMVAKPVGVEETQAAGVAKPGAGALPRGKGSTDAKSHPGPSRAAQVKTAK